ncbi:hypothetical protein B566_EDAN005510 [Ephemera danica]|nr:hypothetical protein B566_EDAN005510 [Ephemera danica]
MQRPVQQTIWGTLQRETNWKCLILTLLIYGCLGAVTWCRLTEVTKTIINFSNYPIKTTRHMSPCDDGYVYIPVAFMAMLYLVYLVECWHSTARIELSRAGAIDAASAGHYVTQMREAQPIVWWKAVCYHYVRRKRQVTRYRHGDAYTATQVYYERVNSHAAGARFVYAYCGVKDISRNLIDICRKRPVTKIRFSKGFAFANVEAATEFEEQRARFFREHERFDDYMEMREGLDLSGVQFKEHATAYLDPDKPPWYSSHFVFWLCSALLFSWPLRVLLEYNTSYVHYQVTKLFGTNYLSPAELPESISVQTGLAVPVGPLSRGSTVDSDMMEHNIRDNTVLVPSYSEALLMETVMHQDSNGNIPTARSNYSITEGSTSTLQRQQQQRRSWGMFSNGSHVSRSSTQTRLVLYFSTPLAERSPADPFRGREVTTPTEGEPPPYEEALRASTPLPALARLRRSLTDRGDLCRRLREQRRSCGHGDVTHIRDVAAVAASGANRTRGSHAVITMETSL